MSASPMSASKNTVTSKALRYALTGAVAGALLAGTASADSLSKADAKADRAVAEAQAALAKGQAGKAIGPAEAAVTARPQDPALRALLGNAYLRTGRFESAAATLDEARQLGDAGLRTALGLALAQIGAGRPRDAVALLDASREVIGADDLGLAYALAGEPDRGIAILTDAVRASEPTPKLRQNLAYALALGGHWREARVMMMQDVPLDKIDDRISNWASTSQPEQFRVRVASMVGAPVVADSGRPEALALAAPAQSAAQVAVAEAPAPASELPAIADNDVPQSMAFVPFAPAPAAPAPAAQTFAAAFTAPASVSQPMVQTFPVATPAPVRSTMRVAVKASMFKAPVSQAAPRATGGTHLVQLGSFSSEANARRAWGLFTRRDASLRNYRLTITPVVVRGKNFWRVAAAGFNASSAGSMCSSVKSRGGACFAYAAGRPMRTDLAAPRYADAGTGAGAGGRARRR